ncbi:MAG: hypothetical protein IT378_00850 [Sandaracinaceae bacterium]|nr:hypothetical protein [Sandaracinaceae bacterium]
MIGHDDVRVHAEEPARAPRHGAWAARARPLRWCAIVVGALLATLALEREAWVSGPASLSILSRHYRLVVSHGPSLIFGEEGPGDYYVRAQRELAVRYAGVVAAIDKVLSQGAKARRIEPVEFAPGAPVHEEAAAEGEAPQAGGGAATVNVVLRPARAIDDAMEVTLSLRQRPRAADLRWLVRSLEAAVRRVPAVEIANLDSDEPLVATAGRDDWAPVPRALRLVMPVPVTWSGARVAVALQPYHALDPAAFGAGLARLERELPGALEAELQALEREGLADFGALAGGGLEPLVVTCEVTAGRVTATVRPRSFRDAAAQATAQARLTAALTAGARLP